MPTLSTCAECDSGWCHGHQCDGSAGCRCAAEGIDILRAKNERLRQTIFGVQRERQDALDKQRWTEAKVERLREVLARLVQLGRDDEHEPEDAWKVAWGHAEALLKSYQT